LIISSLGSHQPPESPLTDLPHPPSLHPGPLQVTYDWHYSPRSVYCSLLPSSLLLLVQFLLFPASSPHLSSPWPPVLPLASPLQAVASPTPSFCLLWQSFWLGFFSAALHIFSFRQRSAFSLLVFALVFQVVAMVR
jgi:hypothetical protein